MVRSRRRLLEATWTSVGSLGRTLTCEPAHTSQPAVAGITPQGWLVAVLSSAAPPCTGTNVPGNLVIAALASGLPCWVFASAALTSECQPSPSPTHLQGWLWMSTVSLRCLQPCWLWP